ncbi:SSU ribosomal protein S20P [Eilatimonas milleporae]|uniref:Small ribosomal subunit protein bS20 n=2 Tax=Eilatimonas milleporae TaxID=911205 RepID=A0A3M0C1D8_9PROT|nr:SSU ribosomal protein S20P [Eilatimonas milleporae]
MTLARKQLQGRAETGLQLKKREDDMANTVQSKKRIRRNERRAAINRARVSRIRTFIRSVEEAIASGDKSAADEALKAAQPEIMRGATKGVLHRKTASRKVSRLAKRVKAIA